VGASARDAVFAVLCFEGPDRYSRAGGLGSRVAGLTAALADAGAQTHLYFIGDPVAPGVEERAGGRLVLHRWAQWISRYYPHGVYEGENEKLYDFNETVPWDLVEQVVRPAAAAGRHVFVLAEDWHTAELLCRCSDAVHYAGLRHAATFVWNANNPMGFERINWGRLGFISNLTTVSRYMKHYMWGLGCNPMVIPNGIPAELLETPAPDDVVALRHALRSGPGTPAMVKVARWDPDKRWLMAVHAIAALRGSGVAARLVAKGGIEPHQGEVFSEAARIGLRVAEVGVGEQPSVASLAGALAAAGDADLVSVRGFLPAAVLQALYAAADAVLANSGMEPFGLVGLEAMAAGAIVMTGATGEDYARPLQNAMVLETDDPREVARYWLQLQDRPDVVARLRAGARATAAEYAWPAVIEVLMHRLDYLAALAAR
jgi:glycosyltransferase involved in cell wall biosynthesis